MYSISMLKDIKEHCAYFCGNANWFTDTGDTCEKSPECIYKAECDNIRYTYGCQPCNLVIREVH